MQRGKKKNRQKKKHNKRQAKKKGSIPIEANLIGIYAGQIELKNNQVMRMAITRVGTDQVEDCGKYESWNWNDQEPPDPNIRVPIFLRSLTSCVLFSYAKQIEKEKEEKEEEEEEEEEEEMEAEGDLNRFAIYAIHLEN